MRARTDWILLMLFVLSAILYVFAVLSYFDILPVPCPLWLYPIRAFCVFTFSAVPMFCLQLFLCRRTIWRLMKILPSAICVGAVLGFTVGLFTASGWKTLGYGVFLLFAIAPAVGCVLALAVYGVCLLYQARRKTPPSHH